MSAVSKTYIYMTPMEPTTGNVQQDDILSYLSREERLSLEHTIDPTGEDILQSLTIDFTDVPEPKLSLVGRIRQSVWYERISDNIKFIGYYIGVSLCVFVVLMVVTNASAYWNVADSWIHSSAYHHESDMIGQAVRSSKITVYAEHAGSGDTDTMSERDKKILTLKYNKGLLDSHVSTPQSTSNTNARKSPYEIKNILPPTENLHVDIDIAPYDNRIIIPSMGKNIPLVDIDTHSGVDFNNLEDVFMKELEKGVVHYPGTALPGDKGNAFIFGHSSNYPWAQGSYNNVFALIDNLNGGDEIIVYYHQKKFTYIVREKKVIKPGDITSLDRDPNARELTLMTCWPIGTTLDRILVFAELDNGTNTSNQPQTSIQE